MHEQKNDSVAFCVNASKKKKKKWRKKRVFLVHLAVLRHLFLSL